MAKLEIPVVIDGVKSIEELANRVLDDYEFKGKTIREWADRIANPETNADRIRAMSDEELAIWLSENTNRNSATGWTLWLKQEAEK